jgi:hypothetical protein
MNQLLNTLSFINIVLFLFPIIRIVFIDFTNNLGTSKQMVLLFYSMEYICFIIPSVFYFAAIKFRKIKFYTISMILLNLVSTYFLMQQVVMYF